MAFRSFTVTDTVAPKRDADTALAAVPQPPAVPRKRGRGGSPEMAGRRRVVRKAAGPPVPLKPATEPWTPAENEALRAAVMEWGERKRDWPKVGRAMAHLGRSKDACRAQWLRMRPPVKGSWTVEEDKLLASIVAQRGATGWSGIAKHIAGRNAKQCRERWVNHLNPDVNKSAWTTEEDLVLLDAHEELGNKWSEIAKRLSGRPDNAVKNRWYTLKNRANGGGRKRQRAQRVAPNLASLLAKAAVSKVDDSAKATLTSLADRFNELAQAQAQVDGTAVQTTASEAIAAAVSGHNPADAAGSGGASSADATGVGAGLMQPPARRRSFHRRSVLAAAASCVASSVMYQADTAADGSAGGGAPLNVEDSLEFSRMSFASDVLRDAATSMSVDFDQSMGLESASFASDMLTALDASLDVDAIASLPVLPIENGDGDGASAPSHDAERTRPSTPSAAVPTSVQPMPPPMPPSGPRRVPSRPLRTVTTFPEALLSASPAVKPSDSLVEGYAAPADMLQSLPLASDDAVPLDELSLNSLSLSLADLSFEAADARLNRDSHRRARSHPGGAARMVTL